MLTINTQSHTYLIKIEKGSLGTVGEWLSSIWAPQKVAIITDTKVGPLYSLLVKEKLHSAGFQPSVFTIPEGEKSKSLSQAQRLVESLAKEGFTRSDGVLALGGGVVGDLAGFVSSIYMRGIHFFQVPTSLLAQVDSSIGGKTGVNTPDAKNLVGTFHQPDGVLIDPNVLSTLDIRRIREGIAEIVKSAAIAKKEFWKELESYTDEFDLLTHSESVISQALKIKQKLVEEDEFDNGSRLLLNFGHTLGHAIEKNLGYGVVSHGEAVAIGMVQLSEAAAQKGWMPPTISLELKQLLKKFHLPVDLNGYVFHSESLIQSIKNDKKTRGDELTIILLKDIGQATMKTIPTNDFYSFINI